MEWQPGKAMVMDRETKARCGAGDLPEAVQQVSGRIGNGAMGLSPSLCLDPSLLRLVQWSPGASEMDRRLPLGGPINGTCASPSPRFA